MGEVVDILDHFPPEGDNRFVRGILDAFDNPRPADAEYETEKEGYTIVSGRVEEAVHLRATRDGVSYSHLIYGSEEDGYIVHDITAELEGQGATGVLLRDFVDRAGIGIPIHAEVAHDATRDALTDAGIDRQAFELGEVVINDPEIINRLPLVQVFLSGGIPIDELRMRYNPSGQGIPFVTHIHGKTDPERAARMRDEIHARENQERTE